MLPRTLLLLLSQLAIAQADVRISEFLASNDSFAVPGQAGSDFDDWIELENTGTSQVDIGEWTLTDDAAEPAQWTFPVGTMIPANSFLVVRANGTGTPDANGIFQTNFKLSGAGEYVGLSDAGGTVISEFAAGGTNYPPQSTDVSYGISPVNGATVFFQTPTPGAVNSSESLVTSTVLLSSERGYYDAPFSLTLSTADSGSTISYTLDGRSPLAANGTPASHATTYSGQIPVSSTTILRVVATRAGAGPSAVETHSYIFPAAVATQVRPSGYSQTWSGVSADYSVETDVSQSAVDSQRFLEGMRDLPTISVVTDRDDLFGSGGLYQNTQGDDEKQVSAEYFEPAETGDGVNGPVIFQTGSGFRVQGGASRNPGNAAKHSFSLRFRAEFGASKLNADIFPGAKLSEFNSIHLRANYNNSWIHRDASQRRRCNHFADQFVRDSYIAMGHEDGVNGRFVHLFLNGLYWGVYNLHERPENDHYAAYSDGAYDKDEVFGYNPDNKTNEEQTSFNAMRSACADGNWATILQRLDVDSYIDFYIIQHFAHNDDLQASNNWRAAGGGPANAPWKFYPWDAERTLEDPGDTGNLAISQDGAGIIDDLKNVLEFRVRFADRVYKHLYHDGALLNSANRARTLARVAELDKAVVGESARWGDNRSGGAGPDGDYTRANNWLPAINGPLPVDPNGGLLGSGGWFPVSGTNRTDRMITKWKSETWVGGPKKLPLIDPPAFRAGGSEQHGGTLAPGQQLTLSGGSGDVYFTTDGSDPRLVGGGVKPGLSPYTGGPIPINREGIVKVRWKDGNDWSALNEARFSTSRLATTGDLLISEVHYHPTDPTPAETAASPSLDDGDFQFLEILNLSDEPVNLAGCTISDGVEFVFPLYQLPPGERVVIVESEEAFALRHPSVLAPAGKWSGALSKGGETIILSDSMGNPIDSFDYDDEDPWPLSPDGDGDSLNRLGDSSDGNLPVSWAGAPPTPGTGIILDRFENWAEENGLTGLDDDSDGDLIPALLEYALLLNPAAKDELPSLEVNGTIYSMDFSRDPGRSDFDVRIWGSDDLEDWDPLDEVEISSAAGKETLRVTAPVDGSKFFFQIRAIANP